MKFVEIKDIHGNVKKVPVYSHPEENGGFASGEKDSRKKRTADPGRNGPAEGGSLRDLLNHSDRF